MKPPGQEASIEKEPPTAIASAPIRHGKIMLIGADRNHILERRFQAAGYDVLCAGNRKAALDIARHQVLDRALLLSQESLLNVAETILSLKDLCPVIKITIVLRRGAQPTDRLVRKLLDHPIQGSEIVTRRDLQKRLRQESLKHIFD